MMRLFRKKKKDKTSAASRSKQEAHVVPSRTPTTNNNTATPPSLDQVLAWMDQAEHNKNDNDIDNQTIQSEDLYTSIEAEGKSTSAVRYRRMLQQQSQQSSNTLLDSSFADTTTTSTSLQGLNFVRDNDSLSSSKLWGEDVISLNQSYRSENSSSQLLGVDFLDSTHGTNTTNNNNNNYSYQGVKLPPTMNPAVVSSRRSRPPTAERHPTHSHTPAVVTPPPPPRRNIDSDPDDNDDDDTTVILPHDDHFVGLSDQELLLNPGGSPGALRLTQEGLKRHEHKQFFSQQHNDTSNNNTKQQSSSTHHTFLQLKHEQERQRYIRHQQQQKQQQRKNTTKTTVTDNPTTTLSTTKATPSILPIKKAAWRNITAPSTTKAAQEALQQEQEDLRLMQTTTTMHTRPSHKTTTAHRSHSKSSSSSSSSIPLAQRQPQYILPQIYEDKEQQPEPYPAMKEEEQQSTTDDSSSYLLDNFNYCIQWNNNDHNKHQQDDFSIVPHTGGKFSKASKAKSLVQRFQAQPSAAPARGYHPTSKRQIKVREKKNAPPVLTKGVDINKSKNSVEDNLLATTQATCGEPVTYLDMDRWCQARPAHMAEDDLFTLEDIATVVSSSHGNNNDIATVVSLDEDVATLASVTSGVEEIVAVSSRSAVSSTASSSSALCRTCQRSPRTHMARPCMHFHFCQSCAQNYGNFCPVCQQTGVSFVSVVR